MEDTGVQKWHELMSQRHIVTFYFTMFHYLAFLLFLYQLEMLEYNIQTFIPDKK